MTTQDVIALRFGRDLETLCTRRGRGVQRQHDERKQQGSALPEHGARSANGFASFYWQFWLRRLRVDIAFGDICHEAIAAAGDGLDVRSACCGSSESLAQHVNCLRQIGRLDESFGPDLLEQRFLRDETA